MCPGSSNNPVLHSEPKRDRHCPLQPPAAITTRSSRGSGILGTPLAMASRRLDARWIRLILSCADYPRRSSSLPVSRTVVARYCARPVQWIEPTGAPASARSLTSPHSPAGREETLAAWGSRLVGYALAFQSWNATPRPVEPDSSKKSDASTRPCAALIGQEKTSNESIQENTHDPGYSFRW